MKLSANPIAQWFVQGAHYSIEIEEQSLIFESKDLREIVSFELWNGQVMIERGIYWGKLSIEVSDTSLESNVISVFGLAWKDLLHFAHSLSQCYVDWIETRTKIVASLMPKLNALKERVEHSNTYMRFEDLHAWQQDCQRLLSESGISLNLLDRIHFKDLALFDYWLNDGEQARELQNAQWHTSEIDKWASLFDHAESSPLNPSQRAAVILNDKHNLILAGAGSGKTSVLVVRAKYLIESGKAKEENILLLAFGKKAADEMRSRLQSQGLKKIIVATFHSYASQVLKDFHEQPVKISDLATCERARECWMRNVLSALFHHQGSKRAWQKHVKQWSIQGLTSEQSLIEQIDSTYLHRWIWRLLAILIQQNKPYKVMKSELKGNAQAESEFALIWPIVRQYQSDLKTRQQLDFDGLIFEASRILRLKKNTFGQTIEHIMVDEYQDISPQRLSFIEALCSVERDRAPSLYAVGDDWQSIYRFAGSDVRLTSDFLSRYPEGSIGHLDTTYRFNSQIGAVANRFIQMNPKQFQKPLNSHRQQKEKTVHIIQSNMIEDVILNQLVSLNVKAKQSVMFIGRTHANEPKNLSVFQKKYPKIDFSFVTAHASKGLEADYVFILDMNEGVFPSERDIHGLELIFFSNDEMEYAEERRLFYVALTRARHACWICVDPYKLSPFVSELIEEDYPVEYFLPDLLID